MKIAISVCGIAALAAPMALAAQGAAPQAATTKEPTVVTMTMTSTVVDQYKQMKTFLTKAADAMPADAYSFQPTPEMRTFAGGMGHLIMSNIGQCGSLLGRKHALSGIDLSKTLTTKTDVVKANADAFAFCDEYFLKLDANANLADTFVNMNGRRNGEPITFKVSNGASVIHFLEHNNEEYGYLAVYLRLKGIVPPSSVPTPQAGRGGEARGVR